MLVCSKAHELLKKKLVTSSHSSYSLDLFPLYFSIFKIKSNGEEVRERVDGSYKSGTKRELNYIKV